MNRIKFYSPSDMSVGHNLERAFEIIKSFDFNRDDYGINEIIEFYNISCYIDNNLFLTSWSKSDLEEIKIVTKQYKILLSKIYNNISDDNLSNLFKNVERNYTDNFWELFNKYKVYKNITEKEFEIILNDLNPSLFELLQNKHLINYFEVSIRNYILSDSKNAEILLDKYEVKNMFGETKIYFPNKLTNKDKELVIHQYIDSENANLNYLRLIENIQSRKDLLEISDRTRLKAKKVIQIKNEEFFKINAGMKFGISVQFREDQEIELVEKKVGSILKYSYSSKWIQTNNDYSTLLNNFVHLFNYTDLQMRISLVSKPNELGLFEKHIGLQSQSAYVTGLVYSQKNNLSILQLIGYSHQLEIMDISIEKLIEWFFKEYLLNEFNIKNYRITLPSNNSKFLEKCRAILPEIESVLKQFNLFIEDGEINQELFQMSSGHLLFSNCKSLIDKKYIYPREGDFVRISYYFFSDQCMLAYVKRIEDKYSNFFELLIKESIYFEDYPEYLKPDLKWLLENEYITINENKELMFSNFLQIFILKDLYDNEVINYWNKSSKYQIEIDKLLKNGLFKSESSLFSKPEQDYFNYHLNKSKFNNSLDLRNMYSHGTQPNDEDDNEKHQNHYLIFLKLFILLIIKINDECCIVNNPNYLKKDSSNE